MPIYINIKRHDIHLTGPTGRIVIVKAGASVELPIFFEKYIGYGLLGHPITPSQPKRQVIDNARRLIQELNRQQVKAQVVPTYEPAPKQYTNNNPVASPAVKQGRIDHPVVGRVTGRIVGKVDRNEEAQRILQRNLREGGYPISNNIGVGITSYNRPEALRRLIASIRAYTDLLKTTVFISDDASDKPAMITLLQELATAPDLIVLRNQHRLGVAGNTNRLWQCLARFHHIVLLNDDVEILQHNWEYFYPQAAARTQLRHFCYRQPGVYGAQLGEPRIIGDLQLQVVQEKPHGAVLYADSACLAAVGYYDEEYGLYGFEHVDWSTKIYEQGLQPAGYWDVQGSDTYFRIHAEASAVPDRVQHYARAKQRWEQRIPKHAMPSTQVPALTFIIPFRDNHRTGSIATVIQNIRAQRYPNIQIILVEQDQETRFPYKSLLPCEYILARAGTPFNKSLAFNRGMTLACHESVVLHDADTLAPARYAQLVATELQAYDACHLGGKVIYANETSTESINKDGTITDKICIERVVGYYEGGSIACTRTAYWLVGGFNEHFVGYGCEDCDFYYRIAHSTRWHSNRFVDLLHLWHGRTAGWEEAHAVNKRLESQLRALPLREYLEQQRTQVSGYIR